MRQFHPFHSQLYLGKGRALYCGPLQHLDAHVYGAPVLHVGIYGPFRMMLGDATWRSYRAAIVPPGLRHALDVAGGVHGKLFVETDSPSASAFRCRFPYRRGAVTDLNDPEILEIFRWIFEDDPQQEAVERRLDLLLAAGPEKLTSTRASRRSSSSSARSLTATIRKASSPLHSGSRPRACCISSASSWVSRTGVFACGSG